MPSVRDELAGLADEGYRRFQCGLLPTVDAARVIGVRMPDLRRVARRLAREEPEVARGLLGMLPHETYEEDLLHTVLVNDLRDFEECVAALDAFLPHVDNWAVCDALSPRSFKARPAGLSEHAERWMASEHVYARRFGVGVFMRFYLDEGFDAAQLRRVCSIEAKDYYVSMMVAWYVATALAKQWEEALVALEGRWLDAQTHRRAIQKAVESRRIPPERKARLRTLRGRASGRDGGPRP